MTDDRSFAVPADLRRRIGQMVMVGFRGLNEEQARPVIESIAAGDVGAVVLYDLDAWTREPRNIESRPQLRELIGVLKVAGEIPVLITVDAEGGFYQTPRERHGFSHVSPAADLGERGDLPTTRAAARKTASELADVGSDMNLAPVVDLENPASLVVTARRRSFSEDPAIVAAHARELIIGHHEEGVLTCLKHFPGMAGLLRPYTPGVGEQVETWMDSELDPYRSLVGAGLADCVLATRTIHPELDEVNPGCLSSAIIDGLLRAEIGYDGVVVTDAMECRAIWDAFGFRRSTIMAVNAGCDILLHCNQSIAVPYSDDRATEVVDVIFEAVKSGEIPEARIDQSCARVLALKARLRA